VLLVAAAATRAAGFLSEHTDTRTRTFAPAAAVVVSDRSADVTVVATDRPDVLLRTRVRRSVWGGGHVHVSGDASALRVDDGCDGTSDAIPFVHHGCVVSVRIEVPRGAALRVVSGVGDIRAENIGGAVDLKSGVGDLRALGVRGALRLDASTGDIHVDSPAPTIDARTGTGDIELTATRPAAVTARSAVGDIVVVVPDVTYAADVRSDAGDVKDLVRHDAASPRRLMVKSDAGSVIVTGER
jgi:hypothetical protein